MCDFVSLLVVNVAIEVFDCVLHFGPESLLAMTASSSTTAATAGRFHMTHVQKFKDESLSGKMMLKFLRFDVKQCLRGVLIEIVAFCIEIVTVDF